MFVLGAAFGRNRVVQQGDASVDGFRAATRYKQDLAASGGVEGQLVGKGY